MDSFICYCYFSATVSAYLFPSLKLFLLIALCVVTMKTIHNFSGFGYFDTPSKNKHFIPVDAFGCDFIKESFFVTACVDIKVISAVAQKSPLHYIMIILIEERQQRTITC